MTGKVEGRRENMERNLFVITLIMKKKHLKKEDHKWIKEQRVNLDGNEKEQLKKWTAKEKRKV